MPYPSTRSNGDVKCSSGGFRSVRWHLVPWRPTVGRSGNPYHGGERGCRSPSWRARCRTDLRERARFCDSSGPSVMPTR